MEEDGEINIYLTVMKPIALKVKKSDTVRKVKAMLKDKEGISECLQEFFSAGHRLQDDQNLGSVGIQQNSNLHVFVQNLVPMRLFIKRASDQRVLQIDAEASDTIHNIKCLIEAKEGIPSDKFTLIYSGKPLEDDHETLASLDIKGESTLHMVRRPRDVLPIYVKMQNGELLKMEVKPLYTIRDVKAIVESIVGFPVNERSLMYNGQQLDDSKVLSSYNIVPESILEMLAQNIQIFVGDGIQTITLNVRQHDLIRIVKDKIFCITGFPADSLFLEYGGKPLDDSRSLASYNIQNMSALHLRYAAKVQCCARPRDSLSGFN